MIRKALLVLAAITLSASVYARVPPENGYWEYRTVCDYETVTTTHPWTQCSYQGHLYSYNPFQTEFKTEYVTYSGTVSCPTSLYRSQYTYVYNPQTNQWNWVYFTGWLNLYNRYTYTTTSTTTQVIPGSCRTVRVWIPCVGGNCQIP